MGVETFIKGHSKKFADVTDHQALQVTDITPLVPAICTPNEYDYYSTIISCMNVDGSVCAVVFTVCADTTSKFDIIVTDIVIFIADSAINMNRFGNIAGTVCAFSLSVVESGNTTTFVDNADTNGAILKNIKAEWEVISNWTGTSDALKITICLKSFMNKYQEGIRLGRASNNHFLLTVSDNLTGLDEFEVTFIGHKHKEL